MRGFIVQSNAGNSSRHSQPAANFLYEDTKVSISRVQNVMSGERERKGGESEGAGEGERERKKP